MTLVFSLDRYDAVMDAFLDGMEQAGKNGYDLSVIGSVASFFVSRVDTEVDKRLDKIGGDDAQQARGTAAIANARLAYQHYEKVFAGDRWTALADAGAKPQRPLWASTGVKDPAYDDTRYVVDLVAPGVVNTMPEATLDAVADHGKVHGDTVTGSYEQAQQALDTLQKLGVDYDDVVQVLRGRGRAEVRGLLEAAAGDRAGPAGQGRQWQGRRREGRGVSELAGLSVEVSGAELTAERDRALDAAVESGLAGRIAGKDATVWGPDAEHEASIRLGWLDLPRSSRDLLPRLSALREGLAAEGLTRVVLAGMGGSSLAPEVITRTAGVDLVVLDTTDAGQVRAALTDLGRTVVVVSSKSGGTVETLSHQKTFAQAFADAGLSPAEVGRRFVAVTDPGSGLAKLAESDGFRATFLADPDVGGRYSALSAFGVVPSALAGADVQALLDEAAALSPGLGEAAGNPALELGAALGGAGAAGRDKVVLVPSADTGGPKGFGDWAEQLIAESTGKLGTGLLPVVVEGPSAPGTDSHADTHLVHLGSAGAAEAGAADGEGTTVSGPLGAQFLAWEYAVAAAGQVLGINPFDQPNVTESKENTNRILDEGLPDEEPAFTDGVVQVFADATLLAGRTDVAGALAALLGALPARGYLAVMAYLDRHADASLAPAAGDSRRPYRAAGHLRLGAALPALHRSVPQGWPGRRWLPADHRSRHRGPRHTWCGVRLPDAAGGPGSRRPQGAERPQPPAAAPAPDRSGRRDQAAPGGCPVSEHRSERGADQ